jgi:hypothetical protein
MFNKKALIAGAMLSVLALSGCSNSDADKTVGKTANKPSVTDTATSTPSAATTEAPTSTAAPEATADPAAVGNEAACEYLVVEFSTIWTPEESDSANQLEVTVDNLDDTIIAVDSTITRTTDTEFVAALNTLNDSAQDFSDFVSESNASAEEISADPEYNTRVDKFLADTSVIDTFCGTTETVTE